MSEATQDPGPPPALELAVGDEGRGGNVTVIASVAGDELHRDLLNLNRADHRSRFARMLHGLLPRFGPPEIESQLLKLLSDLERTNKPPDAPERSGNELDALEMTRPELIFRRGFAAITVPRLVEGRTGPEGIWTLYADRAGKRSAGELEPAIVMGDTALHVHPMPLDPNIADVAELNRWSKSSRAEWLAGGDRVTTDAVIQAINARIDRYIELPADPLAAESVGNFGHAATLTLWVLLSYCYPIFPAVPYLYLAGPAGSGKTRTMDLLGRMVFRPMFSSNTTAANVFRSLHARGGTLLLDEAERLKDDRSPETAEISSILLSGYRRGGRANRLEPSGDSFRSVSFDVYSPKLLACIRGLPPALSSRCINVRLSRAAAGSPRAGRSLDDAPEDEQRLRDLLHRWTLDNAARLIDTSPPASTLANRDAERWEPLFRIASLSTNPNLVDFVIDHAARQIETDTEDATPEADPSLLSALHDCLRTTPRVSPGDVLEAARDLDPDAFDGDWNARRTSAVLRRYGLRTTRSNRKRYYDVSPDRVADIATRYGYEIVSEASGDGF